MKKEFELFIGYLGNGATVCNKAKQENGDYKTIAHITVAGNIKLYVKPDYIPSDAMKRIEETAKHHREETEKRLDLELNHEIYGRILDECCDYTPYEQWNSLLENLKDKSDEEKRQIIKEFYLTNF